MTPFGARVRELRRERGLLLKDMAAHLGVSSAYLSALERGERGKPTWTLLQGVLHYFHIIWDEADELLRLADLSDPKVKLDASACDPQAVLLANRLARELRAMCAQFWAFSTAPPRARGLHPSPLRQALATEKRHTLERLTSASSSVRVTGTSYSASRSSRSVGR